MYLSICHVDTEVIASKANKLTTLEEIEVEFAEVTEKIREVLGKKKICIASLIRKLCAISTVKNQRVPLFDKEVFNEITSIDELWNTLRSFWNIFDYDILIIVVRLTNFLEARKELRNFLDKIDLTALQHEKLVLDYRVHEQEHGLPVLRVKVNIEICDAN